MRTKTLWAHSERPKRKDNLAKPVFGLLFNVADYDESKVGGRGGERGELLLVVLNPYLKQIKFSQLSP